jgi:non-heme chloroperoxidase
MPEVVLSNGLTLEYDDRGDGGDRPLIMIHGVSMSRRYFHKQLKPLSHDHRVLAIDLRAHGGSEKVQAGHTVPQYARDLKLFIEALELDQPVLLGWSMGSFVAWDYVRQFGTGRLGGLIVADEAASDFNWDGFDHGFVDLPTLHSMMTSVQDDRDGFLRGLVPQMFHQEQTEEDLAWMVAECARLPIGALSAILFDQSVQDYRDTVKTIDVPTLICWGRHDALLPVTGASDLLERRPGAQVVVFERSGHCPFLEESEKFNDTVGKFVSSLPAGVAH